MKRLAEIPVGDEPGLRASAVRRRDLAAYRQVLEAIGGVSSVLLTGRGPGRRAVAVGLAAAAAAGGARTVLVECDLAEPALADLLGLAQGPGLHEYLRREAPVPQILQPLVLAGPASAGVNEPLVCIVGGSPSRNGEVLLASEGFDLASRKLRDAYELVVFDGPPMDPSLGRLHRAAAHADVVIACVDGAEARGRSWRQLKRELRRLPAPFAGAITLV